MIVRVRPSQALPYLLAFVLGLGAAGLAACGAKTNPAMIPAASAEALKEDLDAVLVAIEDEDCDAAEDAIAQVETDLLELPSGTSDRLEKRLRDALGRLKEQSAEECEKEATTATTPPTVTTTTVPTITTTEPVPTTPPTTPPPTTPPPTTPPPTTPAETVPTEDTGGLETP